MKFDELNEFRTENLKQIHYDLVLNELIYELLPVYNFFLVWKDLVHELLDFFLADWISSSTGLLFIGKNC